MSAISPYFLLLGTRIKWFLWIKLCENDTYIVIFWLVGVTRDWLRPLSIAPQKKSTVWPGNHHPLMTNSTIHYQHTRRSHAHMGTAMHKRGTSDKKIKLRQDVEFVETIQRIPSGWRNNSVQIETQIFKQANPSSVQIKSPIYNRKFKSQS